MSDIQRPYPWEVSCGHYQDEGLCYDSSLPLDLSDNAILDCSGFVTDPNKAQAVVDALEGLADYDDDENWPCSEKNYPMRGTLPDDCGNCAECRIRQSLAALEEKEDGRAPGKESIEAGG